MAQENCIINEVNIRYSTDCVLSSNSLNILHLNTRSCRNKMDDLFQLILDLQGTVQVVVFTETWLYEGEICNLSGYDAYHSCRSNRGGGVSIFVQSGLRSQLISKSCVEDCNFLLIKLLDYNMKCLGVYNPGRNTRSFMNEFEKVVSIHKNMYICGDFNINVLDQSNPIVEDYLIRIQSLGFIILNSLDKRYAIHDSQIQLLQL